MESILQHNKEELRKMKKQDGKRTQIIRKKIAGQKRQQCGKANHFQKKHNFSISEGLCSNNLFPKKKSNHLPQTERGGAVLGGQEHVKVTTKS